MLLAPDTILALHRARHEERLRHRHHPWVQGRGRRAKADEPGPVLAGPAPAR